MPETLKSMVFTEAKPTSVEKSLSEVDIDFSSIFGTNLPPFSHSKPFKIHSKTDFKKHQNFDRFLHRFFADLGSLLGSSWPPTWRPKRSRASQDTAQNALRAVQKRNTAEIGPQDRQVTPQGPPKPAPRTTKPPSGTFKISRNDCQSIRDGQTDR